MNERAKKLAVVDTNQDQNFTERARKLAAENFDINDEDDSKLPHNLRKSRAYVQHLEKVHSNLRQQLKRKPEDKMEDLDVNTLIWRMFMMVTQQAAVHLGNDNLENPHSTKNRWQRTVKQVFDVTKNLIWDQKEISGIPVIDWQEDSWKRTTRLTDRAVQLSTTKTHVCSDSVLCMGRISDNPASSWNEKIDWFRTFTQSWSSRLQRYDPIHRSACKYEFRTISIPIQAQETTNVRARIFLQILLRFWNSQYTILCFLFLPTHCRCTLTWRWFVLAIAQVHTEFQSSCSGSRWESAM